MVAMVAVKYGLHTFDINLDNPWEEKAVFLLYAELAVGKSTSWLAYIRVVNTNSSSFCLFVFCL
jgi:E3 ubiquitin-protein ligase synoviolin